MTKDQRYRWRNPWVKYLRNAKRRCQDPKHDSYKYYEALGVKCLLTTSEIKEIWFRDFASLLNKPSLDRIQNGDYTKENCRFIELKKNISRQYNGKRRIL